MGTKPRVEEPPVESEFLTEAEAAEFARHGLRTFQRWIAGGLLPYYRVPGGRRILIRRSDLVDFLEGGRIDPRAGR